MLKLKELFFIKFTTSTITTYFYFFGKLMRPPIIVQSPNKCSIYKVPYYCFFIMFFFYFCQNCLLFDYKKDANLKRGVVIGTTFLKRFFSVKICINNIFRGTTNFYTNMLWPKMIFWSGFVPTHVRTHKWVLLLIKALKGLFNMYLATNKFYTCGTMYVDSQAIKSSLYHHYHHQRHN